MGRGHVDRHLLPPRRLRRGRRDLDTNGNTVTLASALSGIGGVTKIGAGTLVLSGIDTYRGPTTVAAA